MNQRSIVSVIILFISLQLGSISRALASETLYYIVGQADWLAQSAKASYHPSTFSKDGFLSLSTPEQVLPVARALYQGQPDLLLLKLAVSAADPHLKWERVPGSDVSCPRYYGDLPRTLVKKTYRFQPGKDGNFSLPKEPFLKRFSAQLIPKGLVNKFLNYQEWQNPDRFHKLQVRNFQRPKVQLQWWYFDFLLQDGSSVVMAFIPQHWWEETGPGKKKNSVFTISLKTSDGIVKRFTTMVPQLELTTSATHLEIPGHLVIRAVGDRDHNQFSIQVNFPEVAGTFKITPTQLPFAAFPTGVMPGFLHTVLTGAPINSPGFSYVSQIPNGRVSGSLSWGNYQSQLSGQAYHEQGRLDDTPARQGGSWTWYHFSGDGWNIFGTPGSYIYLQQGDQVIRSGFHLISQKYTLTNRTYSSPDHAKLLTGGEISFHHEDLTFRLTMSPANAETLVCFPSPIPSQVWGTVGGPATLSISDGSTTNVIKGRMFLESCSWEIYKETPKSSPIMTSLGALD